MNYIDLNTEVEIICNFHGSFFQKPVYHIRGNNCQICAQNDRKKIWQSTFLKRKKGMLDNEFPENKPINETEDKPIINKTENFINEASRIHLNKYDYSKVNYINVRTKVTIKCPTHGFFDQLPYNHINKKHGCRLCGQERSNEKQKMTPDEFIERANKVHNNKYDYSKSDYINYGSNIEIICPKIEHGSFFQSVSNHLSGRGCMKCRDELNSFKMKDSLEEFIEKAKDKHDNKYDYSKANYINSNIKIEIVCSTHGLFWQTPKSHMQEIGCPKCAKRSFSQKAIKWLDYIAARDNIYIQHAMNEGEYNILGTKYKVDGFCKATNTCYQFENIFFHGHPSFFKPQKINPLLKNLWRTLYSNS